MPDEEDWLWRPVVRGLCSAESILTPGAIDLEVISTLNDALDVADENERRIREAMSNR
jgi:hypothetical protein